MIDIRQLRIGNWLQVSDDHESLMYEQGRVLSICARDDAKTITIGLRPHDVDFKPEQLNPIPLTPEILEKVEGLEVNEQVVDFYNIRVLVNKGWKAITLAYNNDNSTAQYYLYFRDDEDSVLIRKDVKYVHQLQNLVRSLTGQELTIKL